MAEDQPQPDEAAPEASAGVSVEVEALTQSILARRPELDVEQLRRQVQSLREIADSLAAFPLSNADEPATGFVVYREG